MKDNIKSAIENIKEVFDDNYPKEFLYKYDQIECLSCGHGTETFLVKLKVADEFYVAKCYDKKIYSYVNESSILKSLEHKYLPKFADEFENESVICIVREYIEGKSLDVYCEDEDIEITDVIDICSKLCDTLNYLHEQKPPIIHRDIKPQNIIITQDKNIVLIDFDISRFYRNDAEADTQFFGTKQYAPPEQYGFSQTDCRADIYSCGILIRYLLTGSEKENKNITVYKPLDKVIKKCTAFSPKDRFSSVASLKKALLATAPKVQKRNKIILCAIGILCFSIAVYAGIEFYQYYTRDIWSEGNPPAFILSKEKGQEAVDYLNDKYNTDFFTTKAELANVGYMKEMLVQIYGKDKDYAYGVPSPDLQWPQESEENFYPWTLPETELVDRKLVVYTIVKLLWPEVIVDYSPLKDDNGEYPGGRVAEIFAKKKGILEGANRPADLGYEDVAYIIANAEKIKDKE